MPDAICPVMFTRVPCFAKRSRPMTVALTKIAPLLDQASRYATRAPRRR